jgi:hypothetical protein
MLGRLPLRVLFSVTLVAACRTGGGGGDEACDGEGCACSEAEPCAEGLSCEEQDGAAVCVCPEESGRGCPCESAADCGEGPVGPLVCEGGVCADPCTPDPSLDADLQNCGACGRACPAEAASCRGGVCFGEPQWDECFVPGATVSCEDVCNQDGARPSFSCADECPTGWAGYSAANCEGDPMQTGSCDQPIDQPFVSVHCCCVEELG